MDDFRISSAWRLSDPGFERDALAFWRTLNILPPGVDPAERVRELCAVAYLGDELIGVATMALANLDQLRARFGVFRCAVAPAHRRSGVAVQLTRHCKELLEQWSLAHPEEKVMGMAVILEAKMGDKFKQPVWPVSGLTLIGYTPHNLQLRVVWFAHARVG